MAKILVVDDDKDICEAIKLVLEGEGHEVGVAHSRIGGRNEAKSFTPDLMILDVMMDEQDDGFVLARELRDSGFTKPILMLTNVGHITGMTFDKDEEIVPVDEFQEKPITPAKLVEKVKQLLAK